MTLVFNFNKLISVGFLFIATAVRIELITNGLLIKCTDNCTT